MAGSIPAPATPVAAGTTTDGNQNYMVPLVVLTTLFFMWGLITSLNDILIPHLKGIFTLSYVQVMLVQFCFFGAYLVMSFPSGYLVEHLGYRAGIVIGLSTAGVGCLMFYPAAGMASYAAVPGCAVRARVGHHPVAGGGQPVRDRARAVRDRIEPSQPDAGVQLARHDDRAVRRVAAHPVRRAAAAGADAASAAEQASSVQGPYLGLAAALFVIAIAFSIFKLPRHQRHAPP